MSLTVLVFVRVRVMIVTVNFYHHRQGKGAALEVDGQILHSTGESKACAATTS